MKREKSLCCLSVLLFAAVGVAGALSWGSQEANAPRRKFSLAPAVSQRNPVNKAQIVEGYGRLPLHFEANEGQTDKRVKFISRGSGYGLFLTAPPTPIPFSSASSATSAVRIKLVGANPQPRVTGADELPGKVNYFIGSDPKKWRTNVPTYAKVKYEDVYPGVDLVYYGNQRQLEYDFIVAPGADSKNVALTFEGADKIELDANGDLLLRTAPGGLRQRKPRIYQEINGERREISGGYAIRHTPHVSRLTFQVGDYDRSQPLIIDPVLSYSTYLGGSGSILSCLRHSPPVTSSSAMDPLSDRSRRNPQCAIPVR